MKKLITLVTFLFFASSVLAAQTISSVDKKIQFAPVSWSSMNPTDVTTVYLSSYSTLLIEVDATHMGSTGPIQNSPIKVSNCSNFQILNPASTAICVVTDAHLPVTFSSTASFSAGILQIQ